MPDLDLRMVEYRARLRRRDRTVPLSQIVLVLRDVRVPAGYQDVDADTLTCSWRVVRLGDQDPAAMSRTPTTAALAVVARGTPDQRAEALLAAAGSIADAAPPGRRELLLGAATTLASIVFPRRTITTTLKEATMPVPIIDTPLGRTWYEEGRAEGAREEAMRFVAAVLRERFGADPHIADVAARLATLPAEERAARLTAATSLDELAGA